MRCRFLTNGLQIGYEQVVKPCCVLRPDKEDRLTVNEVDLSSYHKSKTVLAMREQLESGHWPKACVKCEFTEQQGRGDSMRLNGISAYDHYSEDDITLEIRPGNVCNFACQTCWPEASSRVTNFQIQAGLLSTKPNVKPITNFDFLKNISHRIKDVILLGGEPFYDKNCLSFLEWAKRNLKANITLFSNTSVIKHDLIENYQGTYTIVSSIDAVGRPAEYIRYGTVWNDVNNNYKKLSNYPNVRKRLNITTSAYNYPFISDVVDYVLEDWPEVVSFGLATNNSFFLEPSVPLHMRSHIIDKITDSVQKIKRADIERDQKSNALNALQSIKQNLINCEYDPKKHNKLKHYTKSLDAVKGIDPSDFHPYLMELLK